MFDSIKRMNEARHSVCAGMKQRHNAQCAFNRPLDEKSLQSEYGRFTAELVGGFPTVVFETKIHGKTWRFIS